jgi:hypothetical protein
VVENGRDGIMREEMLSGIYYGYGPRDGYRFIKSAYTDAVMFLIYMDASIAAAHREYVPHAGRT